MNVSFVGNGGNSHFLFQNADLDQYQFCPRIKLGHLANLLVNSDRKLVFRGR